MVLHIYSVAKLKELFDLELRPSMDDSDEESVSFHSANDEPFDWILLKSPLLPQELSLIKQQLERIVIIKQTDAIYHKALKDLREQRNISLIVEPSFYGRHRAASVMVIATLDRVYLFDILALGAIFPELAQILTADYPKKIVHYGHRIADLLYYRHNIELNGVTDTFVAICLARWEKSPCSLPEAISTVFCLPLNELICEELVGTTESRRNFTGRPLSTNQIRYLAKMALLQNKLKCRLVNDNVSSSVQDMSTAFSKQFCNNPVYSEVALNMGPLSRFGFHCIDQ